MCFIRRLFLCLLLIIYFLSTTDAQIKIQDSDDLTSLSLHSAASIYDAGQEELTVEEVKALFSNKAFTELKKESPSLGFSDHHFWVHVSIDHLTQQSHTFYLETGRSITDYVDLYLIDEAGELEIFHSGDAISWEERSFPHRKIYFPLDFKAQSKYELFIHYKSDGEIIELPLLLKSASLVIQESYLTQLLFGLFLGILFLAIITYSFFFFALKDDSFLFYCLYVGATGLLQLSWDGYFHQFFAPDGGFLNQRMVLISALLTAYFLARYSQILLKTKEFTPVLDFSFLASKAMLGVLLLLVLFVPAAIPVSYIAVNAVGLVILMIAIAVIITYYLKGYPIDHFFVAGIMVLILSYIFFILNNLGIFSNSFFSNNTIKVGTGFEVIFLSISMSRRIKKLKSEKEQMQSLALHRSEEMNELKSYYLSNMSHELRTPLNAIMGISNVMIDELESAEIRKSFETIKSVSLGLLSSVNDVLDFSKIEKGELALSHSSFCIQSLLADLSTQTKVQAQFKGLDFEFKYEKPLSQNILGDPLRLTQILNNLLANALKFTSEGNISFVVSYQIHDDKQITFDFSISDTGVGISLEKQRTIFEALTQADISHKRKFGGFGMGLFIVKSLVDLHQGEIRVQSQVGQGSTFNLRLLYQLEAKTQIATVTHPIKKEIAAIHKILVVEDNPINQMVIQAILNKWDDFEVSISENGQEAIKFLQKNKVDLILMDLQMPVMDGYETSIQIRKGEGGLVTKSDIPILALTADTMESSRKHALEIGMNDYLTKPVAPALLYQKLAHYLKVENSQLPQI